MHFVASTISKIVEISLRDRAFESIWNPSSLELAIVLLDRGVHWRGTGDTPRNIRKLVWIWQLMLGWGAHHRAWDHLVIYLAVARMKRLVASLSRIL